MKIIFLDVDGVLDIFNTEQYIQVLMKDAVYRLKRIVEETDAKIVVISNWRYGCDQYMDRIKNQQEYSQERDNWHQLPEALDEAGLEIYDVTPWEDSLNTRSEEILDYLKKHPEMESFVILDDCFSDDYSQYPKLQERLVFVDANQALQDCDVERAIHLLQMPIVL